MPGSEVTPSPAAVISKHLLVKYDRRAWWCQCGDDCLTTEGSHAEHVAAVLQASFVVLPKDQLHQQWGYSDDEDPDELFGWFGEETEDDSEKDARDAAKNKGGKVFQRWVGLWRPADSKEKE